MIPFNKPVILGSEKEYINKVFDNIKFSGDGEFTKKCNSLIDNLFDCKRSLLTTSCSHALDMAAILINIKSGDEVIMPSYTFVSTANAFVARGAKIVFVDIRPDTMNIDEHLIEQAITKKTKAIVPVHYAGVSCEMDEIINIANKYRLYVVEDAAQGVMSKYKDKYLGTIGDIGCYSYHETKNYQCGEGGSILLNNTEFIERAEIIREKGTNRSKFFRGEIDKYSWVDIGSSYLPSELNAAFLCYQLENAKKINDNRLNSWDLYYKNLKDLEEKGNLQLPYIPENCQHNSHMFYIKTKNIIERTKLLEFLRKNDIYSVFHYIPLHSSKAGKKFGEFHGADKYTTKESERLLRLPMYYDLAPNIIDLICNKIREFYEIN